MTSKRPILTGRTIYVSILWMTCIYLLLFREIEKGQTGVIACSALKRKYRKILMSGICSVDHSSVENDFVSYLPRHEDVVFVHLHGLEDLLAQRLKVRTGHFMPPGLLLSQLESLEELDEEENGFNVNIDSSPSDIAVYIVNNI